MGETQKTRSGKLSGHLSTIARECDGVNPPVAPRKQTGEGPRLMKIKKLPEFDDWIAGLRDRTAVLRITQRLARIELGTLGDHVSVGGGVLELRIHHGAGFRVYFCRRGEEVVILLCGSDKSTQSSDIRRAQQLASRVRHG